MADMLYKAMKYMNTEDAMIDRGAGHRKRKTRRSPSRQRKKVEQATKGTLGDQDLRLGGLLTSRQ